MIYYDGHGDALSTVQGYFESTRREGGQLDACFRAYDREYAVRGIVYGTSVSQDDRTDMQDPGRRQTIGTVGNTIYGGYMKDRTTRRIRGFSICWSVFLGVWGYRKWDR